MGDNENYDPSEDFYDYWDLDSEPQSCPDCNGEGWVVTCCDDICVGQGWCFHGDGENACRTCNGSGEV